MPQSAIPGGECFLRGGGGVWEGGENRLWGNRLEFAAWSAAFWLKRGVDMGNVTCDPFGLNGSRGSFGHSWQYRVRRSKHPIYSYIGPKNQESRTPPFKWAEMLASDPFSIHFANGSGRRQVSRMWARPSQAARRFWANTV
jgi:hypothetical protein